MKSVSAEKKAAAEAAKKADSMVLSDSELGDVKIHDDVIAALTRRAVLGIEGVSRLAGNVLVDNLAEIVGSRRMQSRAISVSVDAENRIVIEIKVTLLFGTRIPEVAEKIQKAVISEVESVTGMTVRSVQVLVQDIEEAAEPEAQADEASAPQPPLPFN